MRCNTSGKIVCDLELTPEQLSMALSRSCRTPVQSCLVDTSGDIGKTHEYKTFQFELPKDTACSSRKECAIEEVKKQCPKGWVPDLFFSSQDSFLIIEDRLYARTTIRRWV